MSYGRAYPIGIYRILFDDGSTQIVNIATESAAEQLRNRIHSEPNSIKGISRIQGGTALANILSTIRPAPLPDGPFFVVTESAGSVTNVTTAVPSIANALTQVYNDHAAVLGVNSPSIVRIDTTYTPA